MHEKIRLRRDGAYAARLCTRAVDLLFEAGGGEFLYDQKVMQRAFRDIHAAQGHYALAWDVARVDRGQVHARHRTRYADPVKWQARQATDDELFDPRDFRNALGTFATGVSVVTTVGAGRRADRPHLQFVQLGVALAAARAVEPVAALAQPLELPAGAALRDQHPRGDQVRDRAALRAIDRRTSSTACATAPGSPGVPLIDDAAAQLECRNETRYYSGDHVIFIGHVLHYAWRDCAPLIFWRGRYTEPRGPRLLKRAAVRRGNLALSSQRASAKHDRRATGAEVAR